MVFMSPGSDESQIIDSQISPRLSTFAIVRGDTSALGNYGPSGSYERQLRVYKLPTLRPFRTGDCP